MDKNTLSNYGWIVIAVLVLAVMIALATPFGEYIKAGVESTTAGLFDTSEKAMNVVDMTAKSPTVLDSGKCGDNLNWELLSNGTLHISGTGAMYDYYKYYEPSPWYKYRDEPYINENGGVDNYDGTNYTGATTYNEGNPNGYRIKKITIDEGVTHIGDWAFYRVCVDTLTIPEGVESMGAYCVRFSQKLKTLNLPNSLKTISDFGISRNSVLTTINFGNGLEKIGNGALSDGNDMLEKILLPDSVTSIGEDMHANYDGINEANIGVFNGCKSLKSVSLGSIDKVPQRAFLNCTSLESVVIPNTVASIDTYAFSGCTSLKTVEFEENSTCTTFGTYAFYNCPALTSITGMTALETVGTAAFAESMAISEFTFSDTNKDFPVYMFSSKSLTGTAKIGDGFVNVPSGLFTKTKIDTLYISNKVESIGGQVIANCELLKNVYYEGTRTEWDAITKQAGWASGTPSTCTIHFSDGTTALLSSCD